MQAAGFCRPHFLAIFFFNKQEFGMNQHCSFVLPLPAGPFCLFSPV
jgi:hypothetical protein